MAAMPARFALALVVLAGGAHALFNPGNPLLLRLSDGCPDWNSYYWPMVSFWGSQLWKRQLVTDASDEAALKELRKFATAGAFLTCTQAVDPRKGKLYSKETTNYFLAVMKTKGLGLPKMRDYFPANATKLLHGPAACTTWSEYMMCDLGWWAKELKGKKDYKGGICWDQVPAPTYWFTGNAHGTYGDPHAAPVDVDQKYHPEYAACLDRLVDSDVIDRICPQGGHHPDGYMGIHHWGDGVPWGKPQEELDECRAKLQPDKYGYGRFPFVELDVVGMGLW